MAKHDLEASVLGSEKLLVSIMENPSSYLDKASIIAALSRQNRFAELDLSQFKIISLSLNTQKSAADKFLGGGFHALNSKRLAASSMLGEKIKLASSPKPGTRLSLKLENEELNKRLYGLEKQNFAMVYLIVQLREKLEDYGRDFDNTALMRHTRDMRQLDSKIAFSSNIALMKALQEGNSDD
jgi:hypothetical protein